MMFHFVIIQSVNCCFKKRYLKEVITTGSEAIQTKSFVFLFPFFLRNERSIIHEATSNIQRTFRKIQNNNSSGAEENRPALLHDSISPLRYEFWSWV